MAGRSLVGPLPPRRGWIKSSFSDYTDDRVEVALVVRTILAQNSDNKRA